MRRFFYFTFLITATLLIQVNSFPRPAYNSHRIDYYAILGLVPETEVALEELFKNLNDIIDQKAGKSDFVKCLKQQFGVKFDSPQKHRYMFHWGFNMDLQEYQPLIDELEKQFFEQVQDEMNNVNSEYFKEYQSKKDIIRIEQFVQEKVKERVKRVLALINEERAQQNRNLIEACEQATGLPRNMSAGLITLLWDMHILADYLDKELRGLLPFSLLHKDICQHGLERLFKQDMQDSSFRNKLNQVLTRLYDIYKNYGTDKERACEYLNFLCGYSTCSNPSYVSRGAIAVLLRESKIVRGILKKQGFVLN